MPYLAHSDAKNGALSDFFVERCIYRVITINLLLFECTRGRHYASSNSSLPTPRSRSSPATKSPFTKGGFRGNVNRGLPALHYASSNSSLPTPQSGQTQSSGRSSKAVPAAMPLSGSPTAGSYSHAHTVQRYFFITYKF